ncbi:MULTISPECIES: hypothetical protein [unclassified Streptomyces]|uniref:hypothetical protein n=1 Tax=unclassified Streptomyces TaxID=2593676 RepID=UPI0033B2B81A
MGRKLAGFIGLVAATLVLGLGGSVEAGVTQIQQGMQHQLADSQGPTSVLADSQGPTVVLADSQGPTVIVAG